MNSRANTKIEETIPCGLIVHGTIVKRSRRSVDTKKGDSVEIVTYVVEGDEKRKFYVDDYAPDDYHDLDSNVCLPVYVKTYLRKNGDPSYTLNIQKREFTRGEHF